jgi:hypothetical protein
MKVKIERIRYASLRLDEFVLVAIYIIDIGGQHNNVVLHLDKSFGELSEFRPVLESLKVYVRKNEKLIFLGQLDSERGALIRSVNNVVAGFENTDIPEIREGYEILSTLLDNHNAKTIAKSSRTAETERLQKLEAEINASAEIQSAIEKLGLQSVITRLFASNKKYNDVFREYIAEQSAKEHIDAIDLRKKCTKALGQYFDAIQYCAFAHEDLDYTPLINELKQLSAYYNQQLKARATRRKSSNAAKEEPPIEPPKEL